MTARRPDGVRLAPLSAVTAALALTGGWLAGGALQPDGFDAARRTISALAAETTPHRGVMTLALVVTGLAHLGTAAALGSAARAGRVLLGLAGVATLAVAALPQPGPGASSAAHLGAAVASFLLLAAWPAAAVQAQGPVTLRPRTAYGVSAALLTSVVALGIAATRDSDLLGAVERAVATALVLWPLVVALDVWHTEGRPASRRTRWVAGMLVLAVPCGIGGLTTTTLAPASTETTYYQAEVSLDPNPAAAAHVQTRTVFGDVRVAFSGLAPGITVQPQVKPEIAHLLTESGVSFSTLQPAPHELDAAVRAAAVGLAWRTALGAALVAAGAVGAVALVRRRRPGRRHLLLGTTSWLLSLGLLGGAVAVTYRPERYTAYTGTGVLGLVQQHADLLSDVSARSSQVTPYLRNLVALTAALQQTYTPTDAAQPVALRLLVVSDIHDGNQYSLLRTLVTEERVDAVLDLGDLVTFGTPEEAEAAGLLRGIAALPVPYLFVRGNHDATSATDRALLDRLARVPNVVLLQPPDGGYREVTLHGIRIAGFNDPRWFGDSGTATAQAQGPAREAFVAAYADRLELDLVVSHEPSAVQGVEGPGVLMNGHMHTPDIEGNRVQVGTFTGGGPFSHYVTEPDGGELVGQGSSFAIMTFGPSCRLTGVTQLRFRNVVEGRPGYDSVSLVNGARVDTRPVDPDRTCSTSDPLTVTRVAAAP